MKGKSYSYFARAIRGGRENLENCRVIVGEMKKYSIVLSEHVVLDDIEKFEKEWRKKYPKISVYERDIMWIRLSDYFCADITVESTGVGYEIAEASIRGIPILLFCHEKSKLSVMYLNELMKKWCGRKIPIVFYTDDTVKKVAEREVERFFLEHTENRKSIDEFFRTIVEASQEFGSEKVIDILESCIKR